MAVEPPTSPETPSPWPGSDLITLSAPTEDMASCQLAARWAERFAGPDDDLHAMLERFRQAYVYLDAVTHGLEPPPE